MEKLFKKMEEYGHANHVPIINENGLKVLLDTVRKYKPKRVLEIGTAIGYSALQIAANAAEGVEITTLELSEERARLARSFMEESPYNSQITILTGDAGKLLEEISGRYDFVFIDAAKGQYPDYFRKIQPYLADDAVIAADNVLFRGYVRGGVEAPRRFRTIVKRLREYLSMVENNPEYTTSIYDNGDGLAVSVRRKDSNG
ncbi:MAG: O-methyltransferase [Selenomonadaceae bacterium]|nr:O-methyltransferase [Selenomonadaceae bacterium]